MPSQKNKDFNRLIIKALFQKDNDLPFVLYQKPNTKTVKAIFLTNSDLVYTTGFLASGFVFAPFNVTQKALLFSNDNTKEVNYEPIEEIKTSRILMLLESGKEFHLQLVNKAIDSIKEGELKKVVVSRKITVETEKDEFQLFKELLYHYPNTFKYLWYHPKVGMWLGATPETLLKVNRGSITTTSLAGTLPVIENKTPNWSAKEVEEQQMVTDYILDALSDKLTDIEVTKTTSIKAGSLWHLKSVITGAKREDVSLGEIIHELHPTPAVCGIPKEKAKEFLITNEGYDREFYTGFLGELNFGADKNTYLCVNLRCMKLSDNNATIFIGGGITEESITQSEWDETQHKSKTMLSLL